MAKVSPLENAIKFALKEIVSSGLSMTYIKIILLYMFYKFLFKQAFFIGYNTIIPKVLAKTLTRNFFNI